MRIGGVAGSASSIRELCQAWSNYRDYWDRNDAATVAATIAAPTLAVEAPRQALISPKRGSKWFVASLRRTLPNRSVRAAWNRLDEGDQGLIPAWKGIGYEQYKAIEAIPANHRTERPVQAEKPRTVLVRESRFELTPAATSGALGGTVGNIGTAQRRSGKNIADRQRKALLRMR
ncbi:hypothetical protein [Collimonas sp.]|jgi:hypothetical protein|uniref:hypothetical protein n=1 Tax=Collimonas sp. TaxID=1963772 RepID=UPI002B8E1C52|nr:hypothetical protein [Collimonas sp.]HWW05956.1 hypothetical protein [Collimonas sp.]